MSEIIRPAPKSLSTLQAEYVNDDYRQHMQQAACADIAALFVACPNIADITIQGFTPRRVDSLHMHMQISDVVFKFPEEQPDDDTRVIHDILRGMFNFLHVAFGTDWQLSFCRVNGNVQWMSEPFDIGY